MNGVEFLEPETIYSIRAWRFPVWYFFSVILSKSTYISAFGPSSSLIILLIRSVFSLCFFFFLLYFSPKSFGFSYIYLLYVFVSSPTCWENFFSLFWNVLFCLYCFTLCRYLFNLLSFSNTLWFISSSCFVIFSCVAFSFLCLHVPVSSLCFIIFACIRRFFICFSCRISHWFFLRTFWGDPNFLTN